MENEEQVFEPQVEQEVQPEVVTEPESYQAPDAAELQARLDKEIEARRQLTARAQKAEQEKKALEAQVRASQGQKATVDVSEIININAALEGLSQREQEKLVEEHKLTGRPLPELRKSEDFLLWQQGYQSKVEKERALKPSSTQPEADRPVRLSEILTDPKVSLEEKEKLMKANGLYKEHGAKESYRKTLMP